MSASAPKKAKSDLSGFSQSIVETITCPITAALPVVPVLAEDGRIYERAAIMRWLFQIGEERSPITNAPMGRRLADASATTRPLVLSAIENGVVDDEAAAAWHLGSAKAKIAGDLPGGLSSAMADFDRAAALSSAPEIELLLRARAIKIDTDLLLEEANSSDRPVLAKIVGGTLPRDLLRRACEISFEVQSMDSLSRGPSELRTLFETFIAAKEPAGESDFKHGVMCENQISASIEKNFKAAKSWLEFAKYRYKNAADEGHQGAVDALARLDAIAALERGEPLQCKLDCKRVYFGTALHFGAGLVISEKAINLEWRSQLTGNYRLVAIQARDIESIVYKIQDDADAGSIALRGDDEPADLSDGGPVVKFLALTLDKKAFVSSVMSRHRFDPSQNPGPHCRVVLDLGGSAARVFTDEVLGFLFDNYSHAEFTMISGADAAAPYLLGVTDANAMEKRRRAKQDELEPAAKRRRQPPPADASDADDCVVVGSRSAEDRDEELRRAAISVDDSDAEEQTSMPEPARTLESHLKELRDGLGPSGGFDVVVALTWCEENGADELSEIAEVDMVDEFVASLELKPVKAKKLKEKLRAL